MQPAFILLSELTILQKRLVIIPIFSLESPSIQLAGKTWLGVRQLSQPSLQNKHWIQTLWSKETLHQYDILPRGITSLNNDKLKF